MLKIPTAAIDPDFGLILVDPVARIFTVRVEAEALKDDGDSDGDYAGPYANPKIAPYGPLED